MLRSGWLLLVLVCAAGVAVGAVPRPPADAIVRSALDLVPADDPFPIRRVRGAGARLPELLKELESGPVVRLPRADFEARVRAAGRVTAQTKHGPRVVDATYTAELDGNDLTGSADLGVLNTTGTAGFLSLDPLRLAVRSAKWADAGTAILTVPPGATAPAVWVAGGEGRKSLQFRWSLAGTTEPGERRFELRVPVCVSSALDLELPDNQVPTAPTDVLLTGPFDVQGKAGWKLWRFRFGGRSRLEFAVRGGGPPSSVGATAALVAKYELSPGQLTATFEYELRPARGSVGEWVFLADPGLRVTEVVANNRAGWTVAPPATPNGPRQVRVRLRQPGPGGKVFISATAPFPDLTRSADAPLPAVHAIGAVTESEAVELRVAPGLKIEAWAPGDYHLANATTAPDQTRVLALTGGLLPPGSDEPFRRMPSVRAAHTESEFTTTEQLEWALAPDASGLVARVRVRAVRGPIFQLLVRPPVGFTLDRGGAGSDALVSYIGAPAAGGQSVELARPLLTGQSAELWFEFRGPGVRAGDPVPFPAFAVVGAAERNGWLSVSAEPVWAVKAQPGAGASPAGLWGWLTTEAPAGARAVYTYRAKEPDGFVTLTPTSATIKSDTVVTLGADAGRWTVSTRFGLTTTGGALTAAVVFVPGPHDGSRAWKLSDPGNVLVGAVPVPPALLEMPSFGPFDLCANFVGTRARASGLGGTFWGVRFARPLAPGAGLETTAPGPSLECAEFALGVPRLVGADQPALATLALALKRRAVADVVGGELRVRAAPVPAVPRVSDAYLLTAVRSQEEVIAAFGGTVRDSAGEPLAVGLPPGAEVRSVCVGGRWLIPSACAPRDESGALRVPLPTGEAVRFEVRYRLSPAPGWPTRRVSSPAPTVPGDPPVTRWWHFADAVRPGWPSRPWDATVAEPPLLGGPLVSGGPALVIRSDDEWVRVGTVRAADALAAALVALLALFGIGTARRGASSVAVLGCVAVAALAVAELGPPWWARIAWPCLCAAVVALAGLLLSAARWRARPVAAVVAVLVCGGSLGSLQLVAQPPVAATVLIVPAADGGEAIVAPTALVERLDAIAHPALPGPAVTAATFDVQADDAGARVTARLVVHAFRSDEVLALPLGDVRLERVTVNGAPAFPTAPRPETYAVALGGPGRYEIEIKFAANVTTTGAERDLRFGALDVPDAKLSAVLPGAARQPQAVGRFGRQVVTTGERATVEADLGAVKQVHLRWREGAGGAAVMKVREAGVWDVTDSGGELTVAYSVRVEQGTVAGLRFDVPAELEVLRVAVRSPEALTTAPTLRNWLLAPEKNGNRSLQLDFQGPTTGRFLVVLECAPRKPLTRQPTLRFPRIAFGTVKGETDPVYALRSNRVAVDEVGRTGVIDFSADALRDFVPIPDLKLDPNNLPRAFRPAPGAVAELRPVLRAGDLPTVRTSTAWAVGPTRADATGTIAWTAGAPVALLEFALPGAKVLEVRGPDVAGWNQSGNRVQVWLRAGAQEGVFEWIGTLNPGGRPGAELLFEPFSPAVPNAKFASAEVRVSPINGWAARSDRARGWQLASAPAGELRFRADGPSAPALRVHVAPISSVR